MDQHEHDTSLEVQEPKHGMRVEIQECVQQQQERADVQHDLIEERIENQLHEAVKEQTAKHKMRLRHNRTPRYGSYAHPDFNNVEYQMFQKEKLLHNAYKPVRMPTLTLKEIKEGASYSIQQLAEAVHKHVLTQMFAQKAFNEIWVLAHVAMFAEYAQLHDERVCKDDVDQDAITKDDNRNPINLVKVK
mmetsp:Transcript_5556/g.8128  ORF Transcript_5556/g.8128 Transcript_5556/m.8128 type:complete len:189 (+) Transcript_5556:137-703(+)